MRTLTLRLLVPLTVTLSLGAAACSSDSPQTESGPETTQADTTTMPATSTTAIVSAEVDRDLLAEQVDGVDLPSDQGAVMVAVVHDDGSIVHASRGSDPDGQAPMPNSPFRIGSITKVFTSLLTLSLVDEGIVDLDAPATDYVTRAPVPEGVAVRDLLQHTSGVPNYTDERTFFDSVSSNPARAWSPEEIIAVVKDTEPLFEPGARFSYSNTNYAVLGVLVEEVTGNSYADELRARIIDPLGLGSTYVAGFEEGPDPFGAYASTSFGGPSAFIDFDYTSIATAAWAAGAIVSSAEDLHVLFSAVFDGEIISSESLASMTENEEYGLGLGRLDSGVHGHSGAIPGYQTLVAHAPETGMTAFFVATNDSIRTPPPADAVLERISRN